MNTVSKHGPSHGAAVGPPLVVGPGVALGVEVKEGGLVGPDPTGPKVEFRGVGAGAVVGAVGDVASEGLSDGTSELSDGAVGRGDEVGAGTAVGSRPGVGQVTGALVGVPLLMDIDEPPSQNGPSSSNKLKVKKGVSQGQGIRHEAHQPIRLTRPMLRISGGGTASQDSLTFASA